MAEIKKRKVHSAEFKGKVGLEAVRGIKTVNEIAQQDPSSGKDLFLPLADHHRMVSGDRRVEAAHEDEAAVRRN